MRMPSYEFSKVWNIARNWEMKVTLGLRMNMPVMKPRKKQQNMSSKLTGSQVSDKTLHRSGRFMSGNNDTTKTSLDTEAETQVASESSPDPPQCTDDSPAGTQTALDSDLIRHSGGPPAINLDITISNLAGPDQISSQHAVQAQVKAINSSEPSEPSAMWSTPNSTSTINRAAWPKWLSEKYDYYASLKFGDKWRECIYFWAELEYAFEFRNPVCTLFLRSLL